LTLRVASFPPSSAVNRRWCLAQAVMFTTTRHLKGLAAPSRSAESAPQRHPGLAGGSHLETTYGDSLRHHPHYDAELQPRVVRAQPAYRLKVCGNELDGFRHLTLRCGEVGSFDALLEILEERLAVGVITNLAILKDEPPEDEEEDPFEEVTTLEDLPAAPAEPVLRVKSKCTGARRYPALQPYHLHPYTLHHAAAAGDSDAMDELIESGASIAATAGYGNRTALHSASAAGRPQAVRAVLTASAAAAAASGDNPAAPVCAADVAGLNPLHVAARNGHIEIVVQLLSAELDPDAVAHRSRARQLQRSRGASTSAESARSAAGGTPAIHSQSRSGSTPLHEAARAGHGDVVSLLLRAGAEVGSVDETGRSALHWAAAEGHLAAVTELLQARASQSSVVLLADKKLVTPLHLACGGGHAEVVSALLASGAEATALDMVGLSPAGWAQRHRQPHILPLLSSVASVSRAGSRGKGVGMRPAGAASSFAPASFRQSHELSWSTQPPPSYVFTEDGEGGAEA
jgi:ankyrin repeat protein